MVKRDLVDEEFSKKWPLSDKLWRGLVSKSEVIPEVDIVSVREMKTHLQTLAT
jgi:hypothetical protein